MECQALSGVLIDDGQYSDSAAVGEPLCDEIHATSLIDRAGLAQGDALPLRSLLACLSAHDQSFLQQ
jgi:hypothetical protein